MFAVIFEVQPKQERFDDYLALAKQLKPKLEAIDGFIDNERFKSKRDESRLVSLSTWRDEKALIRWRTHGEHHGVQEKGRFEVFEDYHLRVGEIASDSEKPNGQSVRQQRFDETEVGAAKVVTLTEVTPADGSVIAADALAAELGLARYPKGLVAQETFESIITPGKLLLLLSWQDTGAADAFRPATPAGAKSIRHRHVRIIRDYGMFERREAPQYYPSVRNMQQRSADTGKASRASPQAASSHRQ
jgi:heme-degrading monooxygenase HmoA